MPTVLRADLADDDRLDALTEELIRRGIVPAGEFGEHLVWTQAEHALKLGSDPGALFASNVRAKAWTRPSAAAERRALARWKKHRERAER